MSNIKIIDNFLDEEYFFPIKTIITGNNFGWFYSNYVIYPVDTEILDAESYQFFHIFYDSQNSTHSEYYDWLNPILDKLNAIGIIRIKANLIPKKETIVINKFHSDFKSELFPGAKTAIYYINTNNGYTLFRDGTKVESVENRMVIFDQQIAHAGTNCTDKSNRIVINFNYFDKQ